MIRRKAYDSPFDKAPQIIYLCKHATRLNRVYRHRESCLEYMEDTSFADFRYWACKRCGRWICCQNPRNGWHNHVHITDEGEEICLACYEAELMAEGYPREALERGQLRGMFLNDHDLRDKGWERVEGRFVSDAESAKALCDEGIKQIDKGYIVVICWERMAVGLSEGHVALWRKPKPAEAVTETEAEAILRDQGKKEV
jgi:hypothetical protein